IHVVRSAGNALDQSPYPMRVAMAVDHQMTTAAQQAGYGTQRGHAQVGFGVAEETKRGDQIELSEVHGLLSYVGANEASTRAFRARRAEHAFRDVDADRLGHQRRDDRGDASGPAREIEVSTSAWHQARNDVAQVFLFVLRHVRVEGLC